MLRNNLLAILCVFIGISACAHSETFVRVENSLSDCVSVVSGNTTKHSNLLLYQTVLDVKKVIGHCGCKSALTSVKVEKNGNLSGNYVMALKTPRNVYIPLKLDVDLISSIEDTYVVSLSCGS